MLKWLNSLNKVPKLLKIIKKAKAEVTTNKNDEVQNTIEKLRETIRHSFSEKVHNELLQKNYYIGNELSEANQKATIAEEEFFMYKVNIFLSCLCRIPS
jgi:hypothetical protein